MNKGYQSAAPVVHQDKRRLHDAWKERLHNFIHIPSTLKTPHRRAASEASHSNVTLEKLLSQKNELLAFRAFLQSEFCEENLDFWLACQEFKTLDCPDELQQMATRINEEFIHTESPRQINLDFFTRNTISMNLQHPGPSCFNVAQKRVYSLMENDCFPRFLESDLYKILLKSAPKPKKHWGHHRRT